MKNLYIIILFAFYANNGSAQGNLVFNPSFEIYDTCPTAYAQIYRLNGWEASLNTPDYFNVCASAASTVGVPNVYHGYQLPATGNAYCGFVYYNMGGNYREVISSQLTTSLTIGQKYFISFKSSYAAGPSLYGVANNKMGVKFSTVLYNSSSPPPINNFAHVYSSVIITDTTNWIKTIGSFIADSSYQYINIGNFFDDAHTDTIRLTGSGNNYYYLDDITVSTEVFIVHHRSIDFRLCWCYFTNKRVLLNFGLQVITPAMA